MMHWGRNGGRVPPAVGVPVDEPHRDRGELSACSREHHLPGRRQPGLGIWRVRRWIVAAAAKVPLRAHQRDRHLPRQGQVDQDVIAVAPSQPDTVLDSGQHLLAPNVAAARPAAQAIQRLKDGQLDQAHTGSLVGHVSP
jgi:hypothetical protein